MVLNVHITDAQQALREGRNVPVMARVIAGHIAVECSAVIFDKDCTLIDSAAFWPELVKYRAAFSMKLSGLSESRLDIRDEILKTLGVDPETGRIAAKSPLVVGSRLRSMRLVAGVLERHGAAADVAERAAKEGFVEADNQLWDSPLMRCIPGSGRLLAELKAYGCKVGVASNNTSGNIRQSLEVTGISCYVDVVVGADLAEKSKPHPDVFLKACELLGVSPEDAIMVGDSIADLECGRAGGARLVVGVLTGFETREELEPLADVVLGSVADILVDSSA